MTKARGASPPDAEREARRQLQRAEERQIKAQQQLEEAQLALAEALERLSRRSQALTNARAALTALVQQTSGIEVPAPQPASVVAPEQESARPAKDRQSVRPTEPPGVLGLVVP